MGTNTLTTASDGTVIPASDHNQLVTALKDNFVPRDTTTLAPTDLAGDIGSTSYRWDDSYIKKMNIGAVSSQLTIDEDGSNRMRFTVGGSTALTVDSGGLIPDSIATDMIIDNNVTRAKLASVGQQLSSSSGSFTTSSLTPVDVTNLSVTITTTGRPIILEMIPVSTLSSIRITNNVNTGTLEATLILKRDTTIVSGNSFRLTQSTTGLIPAVPAALRFIDTSSSGTYTFKVQANVGTTINNVVQVRDYKLLAYEL